MKIEMEKTKGKEIDMKSIFKYLLMALAVVATTACSGDFLDENPKGQLLSTSAFSQPSDIDGAIHAMHRQVSYTLHYNSYYPQSLMGDDVTSILSKSGYLLWDQYLQTDAGDQVVDPWEWYWIIVKSANFIINGVESTPGATQDEINLALGMAHFWRGYFYFFLVRTWGKLPLNLDNSIDLQKPLSSEEEIYDLIVDDLQKAEELLPNNNTKEPYWLNGNNRAPAKAAAQAALAQVYLTMAGWPLNKGTEYYQKAAEEAKKVIDGCENGTYNNYLLENFADIYSKKCNYDNRESILSIYFTNDYGPNNSGQCSRGTCDIPTETGGYSNTRCEIKFWRDFPSGPRKKATYGDVYYHNSVKAVVPWFYSNANSQAPYTLKTAYADADVEYDQTVAWNKQSSYWGEQTRHFILLSDVYLTYAEAVGRAGSGDKAKAIQLVNMIRNRADGQGTGATRADGSANIYSDNMSYEQLAEAAYNEHGWETACYHYGISCRYFDMRRMYRVKDHFEYRKQNPEIEVTDQWLRENPDKASMVTGPVYVKEVGEVTGTWDDKLLYMPYPSYDSALNDNLK